MKHLGISIERESWAVLKDEPLYSARFIYCEGSEEVALVVRVEELEWFVDAQPPLTSTLTMWQSTRGTWDCYGYLSTASNFGRNTRGGFLFEPPSSRRCEDLASALATGTPLRRLLERRLRHTLHSECCSTVTRGCKLAATICRQPTVRNGNTVCR
jgi:hypothetical protein